MIHQIGSEKRFATVLFSDISGFTTLSEKLLPEEIIQLLNRVFGEFEKIILEHGGYVDKYIGDCVMALFGAPTSQKDAPGSAVRSAIQMMDAFERIKSELSIPEQHGLHIGINSGELVVGNVGGPSRQSLTVIGDTVNIAARLEDLSEPGEILLGPDTAQRVRSLYDLESYSQIQLKGKTQMIEVFRLQGKKDRPKGNRLPWIHRESLFKKIRTKIQDKEIKVLYLWGQSGVGITAIVDELKKDLASQWKVQEIRDETEAARVLQDIVESPKESRWLVGESYGNFRSPFMTNLQGLVGISTQDFEVPSLNSQEILDYLSDALPQVFLENASLETLKEVSAGHPGILVGVLEQLLPLMDQREFNGMIRKEDLKKRGLVDAVRDLTLRKYDELPPKARQNLIRLSAFSYPFTRDIAQVGGVGEDSLLALHQSGFLTQVNTQFRFSSESVRQAIFDTMVQELKLNQGRALAEYYQNQGLSILQSHHLLQAGEYKKAIKLPIWKILFGGKEGDYLGLLSLGSDYYSRWLDLNSMERQVLGLFLSELFQKAIERQEPPSEVIQLAFFNMAIASGRGDYYTQDRVSTQCLEYLGLLGKPRLWESFSDGALSFYYGFLRFILPSRTQSMPIAVTKNRLEDFILRSFHVGNILRDNSETHHLLKIMKFSMSSIDNRMLILIGGGIRASEMDLGLYRILNSLSHAFSFQPKTESDELLLLIHELQLDFTLGGSQLGKFLDFMRQPERMLSIIRLGSIFYLFDYLAALCQEEELFGLLEQRLASHSSRLGVFINYSSKHWMEFKIAYYYLLYGQRSDFGRFFEQHKDQWKKTIPPHRILILEALGLGLAGEWGKASQILLILVDTIPDFDYEEYQNRQRWCIALLRCANHLDVTHPNREDLLALIPKEIKKAKTSITLEPQLGVILLRELGIHHLRNGETKKSVKTASKHLSQSLSLSIRKRYHRDRKETVKVILQNYESLGPFFSDQKWDREDLVQFQG